MRVHIFWDLLFRYFDFCGFAVVSYSALGESEVAEVFFCV